MKFLLLTLVFGTFLVDIANGIVCSVCSICPGSSVDSQYIEKELPVNGCSFCRVINSIFMSKLTHFTLRIPIQLKKMIHQ